MKTMVDVTAAVAREGELSDGVVDLLSAIQRHFDADAEHLREIEKAILKDKIEDARREGFSQGWWAARKQFDVYYEEERYEQ